MVLGGCHTKSNLFNHSVTWYTPLRVSPTSQSREQSSVLGLLLHAKKTIVLPFAIAGFVTATVCVVCAYVYPIWSPAAQQRASMVCPPFFGAMMIRTSSDMVVIPAIIVVANTLLYSFFGIVFGWLVAWLKPARG